MATSSTNPAWTIPLTASSTKDLTKIDKAIPTPGPKQVLIRLTAAALNYRDLLIATRSPAYPGDHKDSLVPGSDGAGTIHTVGPSSLWAGKEGTSVVLHTSNWITGNVLNLHADTILGGYSHDGVLQNWIVVNDDRVIVAPKNLDSVETASLFTAGATAWAAIRTQLDGKLDGGVLAWKGEWKQKRLEGQWVLTQGTGGVSCFAIQIASALGATVIATSSSDAKLAVAKSLGATHVINYTTTPDWDQEVLRITGGKGVDHVVEVGGAQTLMKALNSTRPGGLVTVIGILTDEVPMPPGFVPHILFGAKTVKGATAFDRDMSQELVHFFEANAIKPLIAKTFAFGDVVQAFDMLQQKKVVGKVVVKISDA